MVATVPIPECGPLCGAALDILRGSAPVPDAGRLPEMRDILPERNGRRAAIVWRPDRAERGHFLGWLRIETADDAATYSVSEASYSRGRAFFVTRTTPRPGRKPTRGYVVRCEGGIATGCECEQATYRGAACRHLDSVSALLANEWI